MSQIPAQDGDGVAAVDRALAIVDAIARHGEPIALAELSRVTGFYKSTLLRLIASLERPNLVVRRGDGRYALGAYAHELGRAYESTYRIDEVILPLLHNMVDEGSESASFHVYHDEQSRMCMLRVDSHHATLDRIRPGDLLPLQRGAAGKLITRFRSGDETPTKDNVVAISMGERDPICAAVACAVFGMGGELCGAISLSGPKERFTPQAIRNMTRLALQAAETATRALGGRWLQAA